MSDLERPKYTGIRAYRDPGGRYMFRYPKEWQQFDLSDGRDGVMFSPQPENPLIWFAAWAVELPDPVLADDVDILRQGVNDGLSQLDDLHVEFESEYVQGNLCRFERVYTFQENGAVRKRKVWVFYVYRWQFVLMAQGVDPQEYDRWSIMLDDCFDGFDMAQELWFASDPALFQAEEIA